MTPLVTALSSARIASATAVRSASPPAARAVFTAVRTCERMVRLRRRRVSLWRMRFMADFVFATWPPLYVPSGPLRRAPGPDGRRRAGRGTRRAPGPTVGDALAVGLAGLRGPTVGDPM